MERSAPAAAAPSAGQPGPAVPPQSGQGAVDSFVAGFEEGLKLGSAGRKEQARAATPTSAPAAPSSAPAQQATSTAR